MLHNRFRNVLLDLRSAQETELSHLSEEVALPASLVVVLHRGLVLLGFDSWRKQGEIPGGDWGSARPGARRPSESCSRRPASWTPF